MRKLSRNDTTRLIDSRNGTYYWVAKLKDGNCWMTQNLDLDLTNDTSLTPEDSDVSQNWNPPVTTEKDGIITDNNDTKGVYSWDFGFYVKNDPNDYDSNCGSIKTMGSCTGWTDVARLTPATTEWIGSVDNIVSGNTYDAHFLIGNFYQWDAATAGTGDTITSENATDSICPKGWRLPNGGFGEFSSLFESSVYGTTITQVPYYYIPAGSIESGFLKFAGNSGAYWSSTANSSLAYCLGFDIAGVYPSVDSSRSHGYSVRCIAR